MTSIKGCLRREENYQLFDRQEGPVDPCRACGWHLPIIGCRPETELLDQADRVLESWLFQWTPGQGCWIGSVPNGVFGARIVLPFFCFRCQVPLLEARYLIKAHNVVWIWRDASALMEALL